MPATFFSEVGGFIVASHLSAWMGGNSGVSSSSSSRSGSAAPPPRARASTFTPPSPTPPQEQQEGPGHQETSTEDLKPAMPECWGHRGASAAFPENTIASFERAVRDGSEGLESDVHVTADGVIVMFHDPSLERTTNGTGLIREQPWKGVIENVRTRKKPHQQLPTFRDVCDLLMRPENKHVKLNIDIKPENEPERLFTLMKEVISSYPNYAVDLSPRLILGLWHPVFLNAALKHVPTMRRIHIGGSPWAATTYFWKHCDGFSMSFPSLVGTDGQEFLRRAERDGKDVFVWTVNRKDEMVEATRWGVKAILTDKTAMLQDVRQGMTADFPGYRRNEVGLFFRWSTLKYYTLHQWLIQSVWIGQLEKRAGVTFSEAWKSAKDLDVPPQVVPVAPAPATNAGGVVAQAGPIEVHDESNAPASGPSSNVSSPGFVAVNEKSEVPPIVAPQQAAIPVAA